MAVVRDNPYGLPEKQWRFVQEYLESFNATDAYRKAGYKARGHSAEQNAFLLLRKTEIQAAIQAEKVRIVSSQEKEITPEEVVQGWVNHHRADIRKVISWDSDGNVKVVPSTEITDEMADAITEVSQIISPGGSMVLKVKLADKNKARDSLARFFDMFKDAANLGEIGKGLAALLPAARKPRHDPDE